MTLKERFKSLNDPHFVKQMIVASVYNTMALEGQFISMETLEALYDEAMKENEKIKEKQINID